MSETFTPMWSSNYIPSMAEDGKFVKLDMSTISDYPSTGSGRFAILMHDINANDYKSANTTYIASTSLPASGVYEVICPSGDFKLLEIYNNGSDFVYFIPNGGETFNDILSTGMILPSAEYYSLQRNVSAFCLASNISADMRIICHYLI